jgi:hypothetical protein
MAERALEVAGAERGPRGVLVEHVGENLELESLEGDRVRLPKPAAFVQRQVELPEEHRMRGAIERRARR